MKKFILPTLFSMFISCTPCSAEEFVDAYIMHNKVTDTSAIVFNPELVEYEEDGISKFYVTATICTSRCVEFEFDNPSVFDFTSIGKYKINYDLSSIEEKDTKND